MIPNRKQIKLELKSKNYNENEEYCYKLMRYNYEFDFPAGFCRISKNNRRLIVEPNEIKNFLLEYYPEHLI